MHHVWVGNVITGLGKQNNSLKNFLNGTYTKICASNLRELVSYALQSVSVTLFENSD